MTACNRCGTDVPANALHITWGGEARRRLLEEKVGAATLCGKPLMEAEQGDMLAWWTVNEDGELVRFVPA